MYILESGVRADDVSGLGWLGRQRTVKNIWLAVCIWKVGAYTGEVGKL